MLVLKLALTPLLIVLATLSGRRWGERAGGWLVGLPLTSGPVVLFLALERGAAFAAASSFGSLNGAAAEAWFGLAYAWTARRFGWPVAFASGCAGFAACGALLQQLRVGLPALLAIAAAILALSLRLMPPGERTRRTAAASAWDLPARAIVATSLVLAITAAAPLLGPLVSGLLAAFPTFGSVLAVFAHRAYGAPAASAVLRGLILGLFSFCAFFFALGELIARTGLAAAFAAAVAAMLAVQGTSLLSMRDARDAAS